MNNWSSSFIRLLFYSFIFLRQEDKPETIVERVAAMNILDSAMRAALVARVGKEMDKRCDKY